VRGEGREGPERTTDQTGIPLAQSSEREVRVTDQHRWTVLGRGEVWSGQIVDERKDGTLCEEEFGRPFGPTLWFALSANCWTRHD
jgi:hypothetical protein